MKYISNSFSLQMISNIIGLTYDTQVNILEIQESEFNNIKQDPNIVSVIGHADTDRVLDLNCNRINISLTHGDILYVAQLTGGRLPEGDTTLPDNCSFKYYKVTIIDSRINNITNKF